jgi:hypothetical protein
MELSRKVVRRHWFRFFTFWLLVLVMYMLGFVALLIGLFITAPIAMIAATYAYEDIFGAAGAAGASATAAAGGSGPTGTVIMPKVPPKPPAPAAAPWRPRNPAVAVAVAAFGLAAILFVVVLGKHRASARAERHAEVEARDQAAEVNLNGDYNDLRQRVKDELNRASVKFSDMHLSAPDDNSLLVSFARLEQKVMENGTNAQLNIAGSLVGEPDGNNGWNFQGQQDLRTVTFTISDLDKAALLAQSHARDESATAGTNRTLPETLKDRLEAASAIQDFSSKNEAMTALAKDAAKAGAAGIVQSSLRQIMDFNMRDGAALESVQILAKEGMRKQALEIAKTIQDPNVRDQALTVLAQ